MQKTQLLLLLLLLHVSTALKPDIVVEDYHIKLIIDSTTETITTTTI